MKEASRRFRQSINTHFAYFLLFIEALGETPVGEKTDEPAPVEELRNKVIKQFISGREKDMLHGLREYDISKEAMMISDGIKAALLCEARLFLGNTKPLQSP